MRITKLGKIKPDVFVGTCSRCDTKISCDRKELTDIIYDQREDLELASATCPVCANLMRVYNCAYP